MPKPGQAELLLRYRMRLGQAIGVSLGAQTDRRESHLYSLWHLWASVWRQRDFWFNLGTVESGTECARTSKWAEQNQGGKQDLLDSENSTGINNLKRWNWDKLNEETWASKFEGKRKDRDRKMMELRTERNLSFSSRCPVFGEQSTPNFYTTAISQPSRTVKT